MKKASTLDARSALIGFVAGNLTLLGLGAALRHDSQPGRFLLGVGDGQAAYVIDTVSGQVWPKTPENHVEFLAPKAKATTF